MASATAPREPGIRVSLKPEDQPARFPCEPGDLEFDPPQGALDKTLARLAAADPSGLERDFGYSCEWWPLSE